MGLHEIVFKNGHWELWICGKFYCSGDTKEECEEEWEKWIGSVYYSLS